MTYYPSLCKIIVHLLPGRSCAVAKQSRTFTGLAERQNGIYPIVDAAMRQLNGAR
ncbi:hypothetical protein ACLK19_04880 [Escherichia coli]